jgi:hypothetical protein
VAERILTQRELNRSTLARQLLLRRVRLPVVKAVERVAGLQAQLGTAPYLGLWSRVEGFRRGSLERALLTRTATRGVLMRGTVHLVSTPDYGLFARAIEVASAGWVKPEADELAQRLSEELRAFCAEPRSREDVLAWLEREHGVVSDGTNGLWYALRLHGRIAHAPESCLWSSPIQGPRFVTVAGGAPAGDAARTELVRRYLAAFGPATAADAVVWSGRSGLAPVFEELRPELVTFMDESGRELFDLPGAPRPPAGTPAPPRLLPVYDNLLLSHADRTRVIPEGYRRRIQIRVGQLLSAFLVDGFVAGVWTRDKQTGRIELHPFARLRKADRAALQKEARGLEDLLRLSR